MIFCDDNPASTINDRRLAWLQDNPKTRYSPRGVITIDNTLVDRSGKLIEDMGWLWDHAQQRHVTAHDYLISNYVCPSGSHYPIEWRRFRKNVNGTERCRIFCTLRDSNPGGYPGLRASMHLSMPGRLARAPDALSV